MNFILTGQDALSHIFNQVGHNAVQLRNRIRDAAQSANNHLTQFSTNAGNHLSQLQRDSDAGGKAIEELGKVTRLLAPAAIPAASALAPVAAGAGAVAVAMGAMGAAIIPQVSALGDAADAEKKYEDAVSKHGAASEEAGKAQIAYAQTLEVLPPKTRQAAAAVGVLKDNYKQWSDSLADDTMGPFIKGVEVTNALLPKTTGLVKAASTEADRFMTIVGGEVASPGLDSLNSKFTGFTKRTLKSLNDELVHLLRVSDSGEVGSTARRFMDWARQQGPTVARVLRSVAEAAVHLIDGASGVGVGLLQIIEVGARLASAIPPSAVSTFLQLALALKLTKVAALGMVAARSALAGFGVQLVAMNTAAAAAPGRLAAVRAAIAALSRTAKVAMAGTGIGLAILAITELSNRSQHAPPDVDKLTDSLRQLGSTGKVTGEAAKHFGSDLDGLYGKVRSLTDPSTTDKVQQFLVGWTGWDSTPVKEAKENLGAVDDALANLVKNGHSDLAAAALKRLTAEYGKGGRDTSQFTKELDGYRSALADAKFEQQLAAESMGVFGAEAQSVQQKLAAQKLSADGLNQSIQALSQTSRGAFDAQTKFEAAIDNVTKSLQENGRTLDVGTEKGRANRDALSQLATATEEAALKARENGASWATVNGIYDKGRKTLIDNIVAITGNRTEAERLAATLLHMPTPQLKLEMRTEDAIRGLDSVIAAIKKAPGKKSVTVSALTQDAVNLLRDLGFKVEHMKNGQFKITAETANARANIAAVQRARDNLKSKVIDLSARDKASAAARAIADAIAKVRSKTVTITTVQHTLGIEGTAGRNKKNLMGYAGGGTPAAGEMAMVGEEGPELVVFGRAARVFDARTTRQILGSTAGAGQAAGQGLAVGMAGATGGVVAAARAMASGITAGIKDEMQIASPSKKTKALAADIGRGLIVGLTGTQAKIKATAADLVKDIKTAFSGRKESSLVRWVDGQTKRLMGLAAKRDKVASLIANAKAFAADTAKSARQGAGLSQLGLDQEQVTAGSIKAGLASKLAQLRQFTRYIDILKKRGMRGALLRQILDMGPEQGYAYASALVGASKTTLSQINAVDKQIEGAATTLGRTGADALWDAGKNASRGFLSGLLSQQKELDKAMLRIAQSMQRALRKALGIRSPARAMIPDGINTTRGVAVGVLAGLPHVDRAMQTVAGRMAGRAAIAPAPGRAAVLAGGGGSTTVHLSVQAGLGTDPIALSRELRRMLLELRRDYGFNVDLLNVGG
ncbi:hypothetical protein [Streptomyces griseosporeus]|uniref:hypothetical protein n=1 Tax=Streptomyces griseosporeus TaxID=1910 RepID=UPI0036F98BA1